MNNKYAFLLCTCIAVLLIVFFFCLMQTSNKEENITEYLENKYGREFIVKEKIKNKDKDIYLWAYSVSPLDDESITFVAGQKRENHIFPFVIPIENRVFYDNYFDEAKKHIISAVVLDKSFIVSEDTDLFDLSDTIYTLMEDINYELAALGFTTTKYTCSVELNIITNQKNQNINFYILDRSIIYDLLYNLYDNL